MGHTYAECLTAAMKKFSFYLNVDKSTSDANKKVLCILVSFFDRKAKTVKVGLLCSLEILKCTVDQLEQALVQFLSQYEIKLKIWSA